jgi:hypothetical protein
MSDECEGEIGLQQRERLDEGRLPDRPPEPQPRRLLIGRGRAAGPS